MLASRRRSASAAPRPRATPLKPSLLLTLLSLLQDTNKEVAHKYSSLQLDTSLVLKCLTSIRLRLAAFRSFPSIRTATCIPATLHPPTATRTSCTANVITCFPPCCFPVLTCPQTPVRSPSTSLSTRLAVPTSFRSGQIRTGGGLDTI